MGESVPWEPLDFSLGGEHCPPQDLRAMCDAIREELGATHLAMIAVDRQQSMPALTVLVSASVDDPAWPTESGVRESLGSQAVQQYLIEQAFDRYDHCAAFHAPEVGDLGFSDAIVLEMPYGGPKAFARPVVVAGPASNLVSWAVPDRPGRTLLAMLNATREVRTGIDRRVMASVSKLLAPAPDPEGVVDFAELSRNAEMLAVEVTASDSARLHWLETFPEPGQPAPDASTARSAGAGLDEVENALLSVMTTSFARQSWDLGPMVLACPIPIAISDLDAPLAGVLFVRRHTEPREFSAYDLALVRNLCLRLALVTSMERARMAAVAISQLDELRVADTLPARTPSTSVLPPDLDRAVAGVADALKNMADCTNSNAVAVRLALPDADAVEPHGRALVRVASHPHLPGSGAHVSLHESGGGLAWSVVRSGRTRYLADVEAAEDYRLTRPGTRSEVCLPIRVEGMLIGTLHLESNSRANYGVFMPQVHALAGSIGRRLADAEVQYSRTYLEHYGDLLETGHDLDAELEALRAAAPGVARDPQHLALMNSYIARCRDLISRTTRRGRRTLPMPEEPTLADLFSRVVHERSNVIDIDRSTLCPEVATPLPRHTLPLLSSAIGNIVSNVKKHHGASGLRRRGAGAAPSARYGTCTWDGRTYGVVTVVNESQTQLDLPRSRQVYRTPIESDTELRLGAFLAGLRASQADSLLSMSVKDHQARTVLMVPTPDARRPT